MSNSGRLYEPAKPPSAGIAAVFARSDPRATEVRRPNGRWHGGGRDHDPSLTGPGRGLESPAHPAPFDHAPESDPGISRGESAETAAVVAGQLAGSGSGGLGFIGCVLGNAVRSVLLLDLDRLCHSVKRCRTVRRVSGRWR